MKTLERLRTTFSVLAAFSFVFFLIETKRYKAPVTQPAPAAKFFEASTELRRSDIKEAFKRKPKFPLPSELKYDLGNGEVLKLWDFKPMNTTFNDMKIGNNDCTYAPRNASRLANSGKFIIITNFNYLDPRDASKLKIQAGLKVNQITKQMRNLELINVLAWNLKQSFIAEIHIFVEHHNAADYLRSLPLENSHKVVVQITESNIEVNTQLEYVGRCLKDTIVAISNQDNKYGEGWDMLRPDILMKNRLMYALTRHTVPCKDSKAAANCDPGYPYIGSHDVFMFHVKEKFTPEMLEPLNTVTPDLPGIENLFIWVFQTRLGYKVTNPCQVLFVYHQHCIGIRRPSRRRVNVGGRSGLAGFTNKLE